MTQSADIDFAGDDAHRFLPWLIGIMVCLAAMLLCLSLTLGSWIIDRGDSYTNSFTVNVPASTDNLAEKVNRITDELREIPGVSGVTRLPESKLKEMLSPWLGNTDSLSNLPLPAVLNVTLDNNAVAVDYDSLQKSLSTIAAGTEIDAHEQWVKAFSDFSAAAQCLIGIFAALIICGMAAMIAFASRASLKLHSKTVHLLHSIGAHDDYITRQFQREAFMLVLPGAIGGCLAAGFTYWMAGMYMTSLTASVLPSLAMSGIHIALLVLMPLACSGVAWWAARISVTKQLKSVL